MIRLPGRFKVSPQIAGLLLPKIAGPADLAAIRRDGEITVYGSGAPEIAVPFFPAILKNLRVRFMMVYVLTPEDRAAALARLDGWLREGRLKHQIAERLPLAQVAQAHELVESGRVTGNVVLTIS